MAFGVRQRLPLQLGGCPAKQRSAGFGRLSNEGIQITSSWQICMFGNDLDHKLECIQLNSGLQNLTFVDNFNRSSEGV